MSHTLNLERLKSVSEMFIPKVLNISDVTTHLKHIHLIKAL